MISIIRIAGMVGINKDVEETFKRLRLRKKHSCVVLPKPTKEQEGMIKKIRGLVAYGEISEKTFEKLIEKRGQILKKSAFNEKNKNNEKGKVKNDSKTNLSKSSKLDLRKDSKKIIEELKKGKSYEELNLKPFFRLHPARGGMNSKEHFPKGVLGNHKEKINELIERML